MKYGSVCSGVEAATLAWSSLGWECKFVSEVEPFPCAVLQERLGATAPIHPLDPAEATDEKDRKMREAWKRQNAKLKTEGVLPNEGDFTKIGKKYAGKIDLLVGGTPCFAAGTMVLTPSGYVPIETLKVGDDIIGGSGKTQKVEAIGSKMADVVKVFVKGRKPLYCTADHQFYCVDTPDATDTDFKKTMVSDAVGKYIGGLPYSICIFETQFSADHTQFIRCKNRKAYIIERFEKYGRARVFNITVSEEHSYIAEGLWSANCQDLSVAGKRAGFNGERSSLALDFVRLAYESQCKWFVWENVPGVFTSNNGRDFATFLSLCTGCEVGVPRDGWRSAGFVCNGRRDRFGVAWKCLDAQFTRTQRFPFAIPQRRRRVFLVGHFGDWTRAAQVLLEPNRLSWNTPTRFKARQGAAGFAPKNSAMADGSLRGIGQNDTDRHWDASGVNPTLNQCNAGSGIIGASNQELFAQNFNGLVSTFGNGKDVAETLTAKGSGDRMPDKNRLPCVIESCNLEQDPIVLNDQGGSVMAVEDNGNAGTLRANTHGNEQIICWAAGGFGEKIKSDVAATISTDHDDRVIGNNAALIQCYYPSQHQVPKQSDTLTLTTQNCSGIRGDIPIVQECYAIDSAHSNSMKSAIPHSGFHKEEIAKTLDTTDPNPTKNQGGNVICETGVPSTVRRLLPIECERLMAFPDNWTKNTIQRQIC